MPVSFDPFRIFTRRRSTRSPGAEAQAPAMPPSAAVTQAGLFEIDGIVNDGALRQLRRAKPPKDLADITAHDPRSSSVVYKQVSGRGVRLNHGTVVEGSVDFGGIQPNYVIDLKHPRLQSLLHAARALHSKNFADKIKGVVSLVQKTLTEGAYDAPAYLKLLADNRNRRTNITLGDYLTHGAGVCRENALLTHLALLEAGVESEYLYCRSTQGASPEDHAVALAVDSKGRKVVVDSYNGNFHGFFLDDVMRHGGSRSTDKKLKGAARPGMYGCTLSIAPYPVYWIPVRALRAPPTTTMPPVDQLTNFRVVRPARPRS